MKKATMKYQLVRDSELYTTLYDRVLDAIKTGIELKECGWIKEFSVVPIKAIWIKC